MASKAVKLTEKSAPRILGEELVKKYATVTRDAITIHVTSTEHIHRTIFYTEKGKYDSFEEESVHECGDSPLIVPLNEEQRGSVFTFHVLSRDKKSDLVVENFQFAVRAELTKAEMKAFLENVLKRVDKKSMESGFFYRNFKSEDEERIKDSNNGYFEMNLKLRSGHRSSPLYRKLDNVCYFSCKLFNTYGNEEQLKYLPQGYKFPGFSPFGEHRAAYETRKIIDNESVLFLGGMHCYGSKITRAHYITVIICQKDSLAYHTCMEIGCIELPLLDNPILQIDKSGNIKCASKLIKESVQTDRDFPHGVWVEIILCDKPVSLSEGERSICEHKEYSSEHKSSTECESCHGHPLSTEELNKKSPDNSPLKRRSLDENCDVPEKTVKENVD